MDLFILLMSVNSNQGETESCLQEVYSLVKKKKESGVQTECLQPLITWNWFSQNIIEVIKTLIDWKLYRYVRKNCCPVITMD